MYWFGKLVDVDHIKLQETHKYCVAVTKMKTQMGNEKPFVFSECVCYSL